MNKLGNFDFGKWLSDNWQIILAIAIVLYLLTKLQF